MPEIQVDVNHIKGLSVSAMNLRPYQKQSIEATRALMAQHQRVLLVAPTGSGKTVIAADIIRAALGRGSRVMFVAHRKELVQQCSDKLRTMGVRHGVLQAQKNTDPGASVQVASLFTVPNREVETPNLIFVDECHRNIDQQKALVERFPDAYVIGLTATPWRLDGKGLGDVYGAMHVVASVDGLVRDGFLMRPLGYIPEVPDLKKARIRAGDYDISDIASVMNQPVILSRMVEHWEQRAKEAQTVVFAVDLEHSKSIVDRFREAGYSAEHLDGSTPGPERDAILERFRKGRTQILSNVDIVAEGFDLPAMGCVILARPTRSRARYFQMVGRCMRPLRGKQDPVVLDLAGCWHRFGSVCDAQVYSLDGENPGLQGQLSRASMRNPIRKVCPGCFAIVDQKPLHACPACGYDLRGVAVDVFEFEADLVPARIKPNWGEHTEHKKRESFRRWQAREIRNNYKQGYALKIFEKTYGHRPPVDDARLWHIQGE